MGVVGAVGAGLGLAGSLFGGDDEPPAPPKYVQPPSMKEFTDTLDYLTGTRAITVNNPDGSKQRVIDRLPRSPQEEALMQQLGQMINMYVGNIKNLASYNPRIAQEYAPFMQTIDQMTRERGNDVRDILGNVADFNAFTQQVKDLNRTLIDDTFRERYAAMEEDYAHKGLGASSAANEARALMARNHALARAQGDIDAQVQGQKMQAQDTINRQNEFAAREGARGAQFNANLAKLEADKDLAANENQNNLTQMNQNLAGLQAAQGLKSYDDQKALSTFAPQLALGEFQAANQAQLAHNQATNAVLTQNYKAQVDHHERKPKGLGQNLIDSGGALFGQGLGNALGGNKPINFGG